jgi:hypothetical protein
LDDCSPVAVSLRRAVQQLIGNDETPLPFGNSEQPIRLVAHRLATLAGHQVIVDGRRQTESETVRA